MGAGVHRARLHVMGSTVEVTVVGGRARHLDLAERRLADLDRLWSRFRPNSDVSRLNLAEGAPVRVASETLCLVDHLVAAWRATAGAFDPTLLPAVVAAGDVASRDDPEARTRVARQRGVARRPGRHRDRPCPGTRPAAPRHGHRRRRPGKGLATDLTVIELLAAGAEGALVSVGGDLRVEGRAPRGAWSIAVEDPRDPAELGPVLALAGGGVATSTPAARRLRSDGVDRHHLFSPADGAPAERRWPRSPWPRPPWPGPRR